MDELEALARRLHQEAQARNERRLMVLHGDRSATFQTVARVLKAAEIDPGGTLLVGPEPIDGLGLERLPADRSREVLGTTHACLVLDAHEAFDPNALGRTVGAVDGGGLYLLLTPPVADWPDHRDGFDRTLAVAPYGIDEVEGRFRRRLVATMRNHPGLAIVDADEDQIQQNGLTGTLNEAEEPEEPEEPEPSGEANEEIELPDRRVLPSPVYEACRTQDQADTVHALETLLDPGQVVVVEADRGRGKSSAAGLALGGLLERGKDLLVTAPRRSNVDEVFARAREIADRLDLSPRFADHREASHGAEAERRKLTTDAGRLRYRAPLEAITLADEVDAIVVDEAAGLPVHVLEAFLEGRTPVAFTTTVHGYEGAGRGFSVRLHDKLEASPRPVHRLAMAQPIRYAASDPLESWSFEALLLDAAPAEADQLPVKGPKQATYSQPSADQLLADEALLREAFGLLVLAHYRTTPSDLARLLDAPNVSLHVLTLGEDDHVVSVALVAKEGGLPADLRERMYEGQRVPGNLLPDVITSQLRDPEAARPAGWRILRIATHPARRREGFATRLLARIHGQAPDEVDWLGTSYGATPELLAFWGQQGYRTVHLSTRRNEASGEHSALQLAPQTEAGADLTDRTERWLLRRLPSMLADALDDLDPDIVRHTLAGLEQAPELDVSDREWRLVAAAAYGPGVYDQSPRPFRQLAMRHLVDQAIDLTPRQERLLVRKVLQAQPWERVRDELGYESERMAMRGLGEAYQPLVDAYGGEVAEAEKGRYAERR